MSEVTSYTELIVAIKQQVAALAVRYEDFDALCDFAPGLTGKVFGPAQVKRLGPEKLFDAIRGAGLRLKVEIDPEQQAKMAARCEANFLPRQANQARPNNHVSPLGIALKSRVLKQLARNGGKAAMAKKTPEQLKEHQKMAANTRWKRYRREQAQRARQRKAAHKSRKAA